MGFLYRLALAAIVSMGITAFTLAVFGTPVSSACFYGSVLVGVALSYADDVRIAAARRRAFRRDYP